MKKIILLSFVISLLVVPSGTAQSLTSGLEVGAGCPAFDPHHVSGPDKNSTTCPMCKYGSRSQGMMVWVNDTDWKSLEPVLTRLENEINTRGLRRFRVFVVYMNPEKKPIGDAMREAGDVASRLKLKQVALTVIPEPNDPKSAALYRLNIANEVKNTVFVYSKRKVVYKVINLNGAGMNDLIRTCDELFAKDPI